MSKYFKWVHSEHHKSPEKVAHRQLIRLDAANSEKLHLNTTLLPSSIAVPRSTFGRHGLPFPSWEQDS